MTMDGVVDAEIIIHTSGGPTIPTSVAVRGSEAGVKAIGPGMQKSIWEALLKIPPT